MTKNVLEEAAALIYGDRESDYGHPINNFSKIAKLWTAYLGDGYVITPSDVSVMMALLKLARVRTGKEKRDNLIDAAGYIGLVERLRAAGGL